MATPNKNTIAPLGSTERTNQLLGGNYFDTTTGKQTKAFVPQTNPSLTFNPSVVPTTVSSANLKPTAPMVLPKAPIPTEGIGMRGAIETSLNTAKAERDRQANLQIEETRNAKNQNLNDIVQLQEMLGQTGARTERAYQQAGVDKLQEEYDNFTNQLEQESHSLTRKLEELDKNPEGLFGGGLNQEKERVTRESLRKQADLAILQNSSLRKYDSARSIADRKIALELEPLKARLETMKFIYGENKELFNTQEKRAYETSIREEERQYNEELVNKTNLSNLSIELGKNGAPTSIMQKALQAKSIEEILAIPGIQTYMLSENDRLQNQKLRNETSGGSGAPKIVSINGVDSIWDSNLGRFVPAPTLNESDPEKIQQSIDQLAFLRTTIKEAEDLSGASGASGVSKFIGGVFVGDTKAKRLEAKTNTLRTNVLTLMTNPDIKKFFGPQMSEGDVRLMTAAGTTLNPENNSPEDMKKELIRLDDLLNRMQTAVKNGVQREQTQGSTITAPTGEQIIIID